MPPRLDRIHGLRLGSELPLPHARPEPGTGAADVTVRLGDAPDVPATFTAGAWLHGAARTVQFKAKDAGVFTCSDGLGDTIVGLFFKAASRDDQAGGIQVTLPLTPRRDALPRAVQLKGSRRWGHGISSTLNAFDNRNPLRPLLLYEPMLDLDLRRDFYDSGRLGQAYLQDELPRMHEAYELWGKSP